MHLLNNGHDASVMPPLSGILETALYVEDLGASVRFFQALLSLEVLEQDDRFCALDVAGRQVLLLFQRGASLQSTPTSGGSIPSHDGSGPVHLAFAIPAVSLPEWKQRLDELKIRVESSVNWPRGGTSLFFRDPDGHLFELATPGLWANY
jgi:catechol 2,3-dioxygenase-like lactoylglutathione lyase family enzyme